MDSKAPRVAELGVVEEALGALQHQLELGELGKRAAEALRVAVHLHQLTLQLVQLPLRTCSGFQVQDSEASAWTHSCTSSPFSPSSFLWAAIEG